MIKLTSFMLASALALSACAPTGGSTYVPPGSSTGALGTDLLSVPAGTGTTVTGGGAGISVSGATQPVSFARPSPDAARADAFATSFLNGLQPRSFAERREFCGYFLVDAAGQISATSPVRGTLASCTQPGPGPNVFASYHTHGAYDRGYDNEVPSPEDLLGDFSFGIDGYVSTPGGRIWRIETDVQAALLVCGQGCVAVDPGFVPQDEAGIRSSYTVSQLRARR
ncbi:DUF4329 domain-containing protein [Flavimaricola marinus]|uniref:DUF4329 domain-containing protein n=1 Tax=Flavimaricola marinus TaxID=1819565 RepID=A0A238LEU6_9RHOB|nr:DUF4329 domain-containing protein [Flavimaricola marinus]SMY07934.1 hypothetical protein LOM8899_02079 [Flavimaricola marinus]